MVQPHFLHQNRMLRGGYCSVQVQLLHAKFWRVQLLPKFCITVVNSNESRNSQGQCCSGYFIYFYLDPWCKNPKLLLPDKKLHKFYFGGSNYSLNFTCLVQLLPAHLCVESGPFLPLELNNLLSWLKFSNKKN